MTFSDDEILTKITEVAKGRINPSVGELKPEMRIMDELGLDSLSVTDVVIEIEEAFDFEFQEEDLDMGLTVGQLIEIIRLRTGS